MVWFWIMFVISCALWGVVGWFICGAIKQHRAAAILFLALVLLATWPLALRPATSVYSPLDHISTDQYAAMWNHFFWPALAIRSGIDPHRCPQLCAPYSQFVAFHFTPAPFWPLIALSLNPISPEIETPATPRRTARDGNTLKCLRCGTPYAFVDPHLIEFAETTRGTETCFPLCEPCWEKSDTQERLAWCDELLKRVPQEEYNRPLIEAAVRNYRAAPVHLSIN